MIKTTLLISSLIFLSTAAFSQDKKDEVNQTEEESLYKEDTTDEKSELSNKIDKVMDKVSVKEKSFREGSVYNASTYGSLSIDGASDDLSAYLFSYHFRKPVYKIVDLGAGIETHLLHNSFSTQTFNQETYKVEDLDVETITLALAPFVEVLASVDYNKFNIGSTFRYSRSVFDTTFVLSEEESDVSESDSSMSKTAFGVYLAYDYSKNSSVMVGTESGGISSSGLGDDVSYSSFYLGFRSAN
jgi:hypothetical protein